MLRGVNSVGPLASPNLFHVESEGSLLSTSFSRSPHDGHGLPTRTTAGGGGDLRSSWTRIILARPMRNLLISITQHQTELILARNTRL